jgi:hypothetical protein
MSVEEDGEIPEGAAHPEISSTAELKRRFLDVSIPDLNTALKKSGFSARTTKILIQ